MQNKTKSDGDWDGWGDYMETKRKKLTNQFADEKFVPGEKRSSLFSGIAIYVNGYTNPPADVLKRMIIQHGGEYLTYQSSRTTHVIATNLPHSKIVKLKQSDKIMKPEWIVDSVKRNQLLPEKDYQLYLKEVNKIANYVADAKPQTSTEEEKKKSYRFPTADAKDPNFIKNYYAQSRLHMISTWGQEMKQFVKELKQSNDQSFPGRQLIRDHLNQIGKCEESFNPKGNVIMHLDMDCFFVSVGLRDRPSLKGLPVVVTHSRGKGPTAEFVSHAEIASCSYEARDKGVRNGMWLGEVLKLCPNVKTISYDFDKYKEVSKVLYEIVANFTLCVEAVSCDELYVDLTDVCQQTGASPLDVATVIRKEIFMATSCTASAGIGPNMLVARLATRKAKPNGQYYVTADDVAQFMKRQKIEDLPGVGRRTAERLDHLKIYVCYDLAAVPLSVLQREFGAKTGENLYKSARGIDERKIKDNDDVGRKSVSCDVNYGIRFTELHEVEKFLHDLSEEVVRRLNEIDMKGRTICLKCLVRSYGAPTDTAKFLGHGIVDSFSKSSSLHIATSRADIIAKECVSLFKQMNLNVADLRGIGIAIQKLQSNSTAQSVSSDGIMKFVRNKCTKSANKDEQEVVKIVDDKFPATLSADLNPDPSFLQSNSMSRVDTSEKHVFEIPVRLENKKPPHAGDKNKNDVEISINKELEFCGCTTFDNVSTLLKNWITIYDDPGLLDDCALLSKYLMDLIKANQMEKAYRLILVVHRSLKKVSGKEKWLEFYRSVVDKVQDVVKEKFVLPLHLPLI